MNSSPGGINLLSPANLRAVRLFQAAALLLAVLVSACSPVRVSGPDASPRADPFLEEVQARTFRFFWDLSNPRNGLTPDRAPTRSFSSVAAVGFALTAYPIGVERGYITRDQAEERVLTTLKFFWNAPQGTAPSGITGHNGFFYHFLDMDTGHRFGTVELSTIDTALLIAGVLFCQEYFDNAADEGETAIRAYADSLYLRIDWQWAQNNPPLISMGWTPENGFIPHEYRGYNEAMLLYILALGSPTHPASSGANDPWQGFVADYKWGTFHGQSYVQFGPLFGYQYSHVWIDFRGIHDTYMRGRGIDYFENSRRATLAHRAYAIANPMGWAAYDGNLWGLTASDGPLDSTLTIDGKSRTFHSYWARGVAATELNDDGTLVPTAAGGSIPFAPEIAIPALKAMRDRYGDNLFSTYGFVDAFNPTLKMSAPPPLKHGRVVPNVGWFDTDYLGIDQGPILAMIQNYETELVWREMRDNPHIIRGLKRAGFTGGWLDRISGKR
ncbi:MAG: glucoamylase family protein [Gemmatimonadaceae bacterium]